MRRNRWIFAAGCVLLVAAAGAVVIWPKVVSRREIPKPAEIASLDPDIAAIVEQMIAQVEASPNDPSAWVRLGMTYEANDQLMLALQTYDAVTHLAPRDSRGWFGLAKVNIALGETETAIASMQRAIELEPAYAPSHWRLGYWLFEAGRVDDAMKSLERAAELDPADPAPRFGLARIELSRGNADRARALLEPLCNLPPPQGPYAWQLLAGALRQLGLDDDAETARLRGLGAAPTLRDPWDVELTKLERGYGAQLNQAKSLLAFGRAKESLDLLLQLRRRRSDDPMLLTNIAMAHRALGAWEDSREPLRQALAINPTFLHAHFGLAATTWAEAQSISRSAAFEAKANEALASLDTALSLNSSYAPAHGLRGDILAALGRHKEAIAAFAQAHHLQPEQPVWLHRAAQSMMALDQWQEAADALDVVTRQAPTFAEAWSDCSVTLAHLGQRDAASRALAQAQRLAPSASHVADAQAVIGNLIRKKAVGP